MPLVKRIVVPGRLESRTSRFSQLPTIESEELLPYSDIEYEQLIRKLDANPAILDTQLQGRISLFSDHSIHEYIKHLTEIKENSTAQ